MKNNSGITLVALVVIVVLLIIFSSAAIYTSVNAYKLVELQKYKSQMQLIQSALDEFYEECENEYSKNKIELNNITNPFEKKIFLHYFLHYKNEKASGSIIDYIKTTPYDDLKIIKNYGMGEEDSKANEWWNTVAPNNYGISTTEPEILEQYYYLTKDEVEDILGVKDIDISEGFIINFQERYVFSVDFIEIDYDGRNPGEELKKIYCIYELDEQEKVIKFEVKNTSGTLEIEVIENTLTYKRVRIKLNGQESIIKELYFANNDFTDTNTKEEDLIVKNRKDLFSEVTGLGTDIVEFKIIKENYEFKDGKEGGYVFWAKDSYDGEYYGLEIIKVKFHEPTVYEENMVPFMSITENKGRIYPANNSDNLNKWYDYANEKYATVLITEHGFNYEENKGKTFNINEDHIVKIWIPKSLYQDGTIGGFRYIRSSNFINKSGIWVGAKWDTSLNKWVPDLDYNPYRNAAIFEFDGTKIQYGDTELKDSSNNGYTFSGTGVTFDDENNCITFSGQSGSGLISNNRMKLGDTFTIEICFERALDKEDGILLDARFENESGIAKGYQPLWASSTQIECCNAYSNKDIVKNVDIGNKINIVQIVVNKNICTIKLNGIEIEKNSNFGNSYTDFESYLYIGKRFKKNNSGEEYNFKGNIYAIRIHDSILSESQLNNNYKSDLSKYINSSLIFELDGTKINAQTNLNTLDTSFSRHTFAGSGYTLDSVNNCLTLGGTGGLISNNPIKFGNEFTIEIAFKAIFDVSNKSVYHILDARTLNESNRKEEGIQPLYIEKQGKIQIHNGFDGISRNYTGKKTNGFNILQMTLKEGMITAILNGTEIYSEDKNFGNSILEDFENVLYIGQRYTNGNNFKGNIYAIRIYNKALSNTTLENNYKSDFKKYNTYITDDIFIHYNGIYRGNDSRSWKDISGNENHGMIVQGNGKQTSGNWTNNSLNTGGTVAMKSLNDITLTENFTAEITFKSSELNGKFLLDARDGSNSGYQPMYYNGTETVQVWNGITGAQIINKNLSVGNISDGTIKTLQLVIGNKTIKTYVNGVLKGTQNYTEELKITSAPIYIGQRYTGTNNGHSLFNGEIYAVRVYNRALTEEELTINYNFDNRNFSE